MSGAAKWIAFTILCLTVVIVHPYVDHGSDSDDALLIGSGMIAKQQNPYLARTQLGNPLTPMLGWLALMMPCLVIGAPLAGLVWVGFSLTMMRPIPAIVMLVIAAKSCVQGIDYAANACAVLWLCSLLQTDVCVGDAAAPAVEPIRSDRGDYSDVSEWDLLVDWMGGASDKPEVCGSDRGDYAVRCLCAGVLLLLPAIWVSNAAYHTILALPFILNSRI